MYFQPILLGFTIIYLLNLFFFFTIVSFISDPMEETEEGEEEKHVKPGEKCRLKEKIFFKGKKS